MSKIIILFYQILIYYSSLISLSDYKDLIFSSIPMTYSGRYTIDFWLKVNQIHNLINPIHIIYENYIGISFYSDPLITNNIKIVCFPEEFFFSPIGMNSTTEIEDLLSNTNRLFNGNSISNSYSNKDGTWIYIRCGYSFDNEEFYLNDLPIQKLQQRKSFNSFSYEVPFRFFPNEAESTCNLKVLNSNLNRQSFIYIHTIHLYQDYIDQVHIYSNSYLYNIITSLGMMSELVAVVDFENFSLSNSQLPYKIQNLKTGLTANYLNLLERLSTFDSFSNDKVTLCDPLLSIKYNPISNTCIPTGGCIGNILLCYDNNKAITCKKDYFLNTSNSQCGLTCPSGYMRSPEIPYKKNLPNSSIVNGSICNFKCNSYMSSCNTGLTNTELLSDLSESFTCNSSSTRIGYKCIDNSILNNNENKPYLLFSSCFSSPRLEYNLSFETQSLLLYGGYIIEAWMRIEYINEECKKNQILKGQFRNEKKYYLLIGTHTIYSQEDSFYYENTVNSPKLKSIIKINQYKWNKILIEVSLPYLNSKNEGYIKVYSNYNFNSDYLFFSKLTTNQEISSDFSLSSLSFSHQNFGSVYYKYIRIYDIKKISPFSIQYLSETAFSGTSIKNNKNEVDGLIVEYDFNAIEAFENEAIVDYIENESIKLPYSSSIESENISKDRLFLYNYAYGFDYENSNKGYYNSNPNLFNTNYINLQFSKCDPSCLSCLNNLSFPCNSCNEGYLHMSSACMRNNFKYVKVKSHDLNMNLNLPLSNNQNQSQGQVTITFWMKLVSLKKVNSMCIEIIILNQSENGRLCMMYYPKEDVLLNKTSQIFSLNLEYLNNVMYSYTLNDSSKPANQRIFGIWTLISISYIEVGDDEIYNHKFPNMNSFYINEDEVIGLKHIPNSNGFKVNDFIIKNNIVALFADIRVYSKFIHQPYGWINSLSSKLDGLYSNLKLYSSLNSISNSQSSCLNPLTDIKNFNSNTNTIPLSELYECIDDLNPFLNSLVDCNMKFLNSTNTLLSSYRLSDSDICSNNQCNSSCDSKKICSGKDSFHCSCAIDDYGKWLVFDEKTNKSQCNISNSYGNDMYFDYSTIENITISNIKSSTTNDFSISMWVYVYSYMNDLKNEGFIENSGFDEFNLIWNSHLKIKLSQDSKFSFKVICFPFTNPSLHIEEIGLDYKTWRNVKCGVSLLKSKAYINNQVLQTLDFSSVDKGNLEKEGLFLIQTGMKFNYGFIYVKDIKIWDLFDIKDLDMYCSIVDLNSSLFHYFLFDFKSFTIYDSLNRNINSRVSTSSKFKGYFLMNYLSKLSNASFINTNITSSSSSSSNCTYALSEPDEGYGNRTYFLISCISSESPLEISYYNFYYLLPDSERKIYFKTQSKINFASTNIPSINSSELISITYIDFYCEIINKNITNSGSTRVKILPDSIEADYFKAYNDTINTNSSLNQYKIYSIISNIRFNASYNISDEGLNHVSKTISSFTFPVNSYVSSYKSNRKLNVTSNQEEFSIEEPICEENLCSKNNSECKVITKYSKCICKNQYTGLKCHLNLLNSQKILSMTEVLVERITNIKGFYEKFTTKSLIELMNINKEYNYYKHESICLLVLGNSYFYENDYFYYNFFIYIDFIIDKFWYIIGRFPLILLNTIDSIMSHYMYKSNNNINNQERVSNEIYEKVSRSIYFLLKRITSTITLSSQNNNTILKNSDLFNKDEYLYSNDRLLFYSIRYNYQFSNFYIDISPVYKDYDFNEYYSFINSKNKAKSKYFSWINMTQSLNEYLDTRYESDIEKIRGLKKYNLRKEELFDLMGIRSSDSYSEDSYLLLTLNDNIDLSKVIISENNNENLTFNKKDKGFTSILEENRNLQSNSTSSLLPSLLSINLDYVIWKKEIIYFSPNFFYNSSLINNISSYFYDYSISHSNGNDVEIVNSLNEISIYMLLSSTNSSFISYINMNFSDFYTNQTDNSNEIPDISIIDTFNLDNELYTMPRYIYKNGTVDRKSTVLDRILKYYKQYRLSCNYLNKQNYEIINDDELVFKNITSDFTFQCKSKRLSLFVMTYSYKELNTSDSQVNQTMGRGYFLKYPRLFNDASSNIISNILFLGFMIMTLLLNFVSFIFYFLDKPDKNSQLLISFVKKSIVKEKFKYFNNQQVDLLIKRLSNLIDSDNLNADFIIKRNENANEIEKRREKEKTELVFNKTPPLTNKINENVSLVNPNIEMIKKYIEVSNKVNRAVEEIADITHTAKVNKEKWKDEKDLYSKDFKNENQNEGLKMNNLTTTKRNSVRPSEKLELKTEIPLNSLNIKEKDELIKYDGSSSKASDDNDYIYREPILPKGCWFFIYNLTLRHSYISIFTRSSNLNPRFKKILILSIFFNITLLFNIVFHIVNENMLLINSGVINFNMNIMLNLSIYSSLSVIISNLILIPIVYLLRIESKWVDFLYEDIKKNEDLSLVNEYKRITSKNIRYTLIGISLQMFIFLINFYFTVTFGAVWYESQVNVLISMMIGVLIDFVIYELLIEVVILVFSKIKSEKSKVLADKLTLYRHFKSMS